MVSYLKSLLKTYRDSKCSVGKHYWGKPERINVKWSAIRCTNCKASYIAANNKRAF